MASQKKRHAAARITTIEGPRSVTKGQSTLAEYGAQRKRMISGSSKVGKSRFA